MFVSNTRVDIKEIIAGTTTQELSLTNDLIADLFISTIIHFISVNGN